MPWESDFVVPKFIFEKQRAGSIHNALTIHEHQILPLVNNGDKSKKGIDAIKCLLFAAYQAGKNQERRAALMKISDEDWDPLAVDSKKLYIKKENSRTRARKPKNNAKKLSAVGEEKEGEDAKGSSPDKASTGSQAKAK